MRQFLNLKEVSYNAIFYSAFKALIVFELLLESPKTLEQISELIGNRPYIKSTISKDTLRVYINSFKKAGCNIEKTLTGEKRREYAYYIPDNPFRPVISKSQTKQLFDIYDMIMYNMPFQELLNFELLIRKFDKWFNDKSFHQLYEEHSLLKDFDVKLLSELEQCCRENALITVLYNSPRSGFKEIPIIAHTMKIQNYKLYLEGFGKEYNQEGIFLVSRISKITNIISGENVNMPNDNLLEIICEFYNPQIQLTENETIISETGSTRLIKHITSNKILTNQRFLQLGDNCKILEPEYYQKEFITLLKSTKEVYENGK